MQRLKDLDRQFESVFTQVSVRDYKRFLEQFEALDQPLNALSGGAMNVYRQDPGLWAAHMLRRGIAHMELAESGDRKWALSKGLAWLLTAYDMRSPDAPFVIAQVLRLPWAAQLLAAPRIPEAERYNNPGYEPQGWLRVLQERMSNWELELQGKGGSALAANSQPPINLAERRARFMQHAADVQAQKAPAAAPQTALSAAPTAAVYATPPAAPVPKSQAEIAYLKGSANWDRRDIKAAIPDLQEAVRLEPGNVDYLQRLAAAYRLSEDVSAAVPVYERALSLRPNDPYLHLGIAEAFLSIGRKEEALKSANRAVALRPDSGYFRFERDAIARRVQEATK